MQFCPGQYEPKMPSGQRALDHLEAVDLDLRLAIGMQRVKV